MNNSVIIYSPLSYSRPAAVYPQSSKDVWNNLRVSKPQHTHTHIMKYLVFFSYQGQDFHVVFIWPVLHKNTRKCTNQCVSTPSLYILQKQVKMRHLLCNRRGVSVWNQQEINNVLIRPAAQHDKWVNVQQAEHALERKIIFVHIKGALWNFCHSLQLDLLSH